MKHRIAGKKLNRKSDHRRALLRNLAASFIENGKIVTTLEKGRFLKPQMEELVGWAKKGTLAARRRLYAFLPKEAAVKKIFSEVAPLFRTKNSGYTRLIKLNVRRGDRALLARLEWSLEPVKKVRK